jgi:hypothetical protein
LSADKAKKDSENERFERTVDNLLRMPPKPHKGASPKQRRHKHAPDMRATVTAFEPKNAPN